MNVVTPVKEASLAEKICAMRQPATYPHEVRQVRALETHFAWVFLAGEFAYKLKKPVQYQRMNQASLGARRHSCYAELELNRRLAPQVYLAVVPLLAGASGELSLHSAGEPVEWLVKMHCLSEEWFLDRCIRDRRLELQAVHAVGHLLTNFYISRDSEPMSADTYCKRLRTQVQVNQRELLSPELNLPIELVNDIAQRQQRFLQKEAKLIGTRAEQGRIVEAHGDLRPEHIHLASPGCVIDCLEFDRDLRLHDPLEELANLSMECEMLDAVWVGREIIEIYGEQNGHALSETLLRFYCSHRATSRAKLVAWHLRDPLYKVLADWQARATRYLLLARNHLDEL